MAPEVFFTLASGKYGDQQLGGHVVDDVVRIDLDLREGFAVADVEFYELRLKVGQRLKSAGHFSGTREFLTIQTGTVKIESGGESLTMRKGDSGHYIADIDHVIENIGKTEAVIFLVDIYASDR